MALRARRWTWTLNNYTQEEEVAIRQLDVSGTEAVTYVCFGQEIGPSGTPHLQGYVEFRTLKSIRGVKISLKTNRLNMRRSRGTPMENKKYCSKTREEDEVPNEVFYESGTMQVGQGARSDLDIIRSLILGGSSELEIADQYFGSWVRNRKSFQAYRTLSTRTIQTARYEISTFPTEWSSPFLNYPWQKTLILWGDSGIGKTEFAIALLPGALIVSHMDDLANYDEGFHSGIIFDDVDISHFPRTAQIHLVDQSLARSIHVRYTTALIPAHTKKIFTTNEQDGHCMLVHDSAIKRRTDVHHLGHFQ